MHDLHIKTAKAPPPLDEHEPQRVAQTILEWGLHYVVLTSVDRDDLLDGAQHIADTVSAMKRGENATWVEVLCPDLGGREASIESVVESGLEVCAPTMCRACGCCSWRSGAAPR